MLKFLRGILILAFIVVGIIAGIEISAYYSIIGVVSRIIHDSPAYGTWSTLAFCCLGALIGVLTALYLFRNLIGMSKALDKMPPNDKVAYLAGIIIGLLFTVIISPIISDIVTAIIGTPDPTIRVGSPEYQNALASVIRHRQILFVASMMVLGTAFMYIGCILMMGIKGEIGHFFKPGKSATDSPNTKIKILDTNVIIDGRIADICRAGFLEGQIYIPGFVLEELQHIADSSDNLKRARGRRGLDILNTLQKDINLFIRTYDGLVPDGNDEVDAKLVRLAKELKGIIVTNDFNLNKVAELEGVPVLNVNELANAMKPVVLPGEEMEVTIIKEGKESSQGIGYLDDGTMIVVEGAMKSINETVPVIVTSVLQTVAGKMIFANLKSIMEEEDDLIDRNLRSYSGGRPRKKI